MATPQRPNKTHPPSLKREIPSVDRSKLGQTIAARWPALWTYLAEDRWEDGSPRQVATLLVVCDPDGLKGCLNDRANARSLWATGLDLGDVLDSLEALVNDPNPPWRLQRKM